MRIDILVVAYRARDYLAKCLSSVSQYTGEGFRLTVYDNRPKNYPLTWIWNRFAEASQRELLVYLNPDVIVGPGWDTELIHCFQENPQVAVAAPITNSDSHRRITNPVPQEGLELSGIEVVQDSLKAIEHSLPRFYRTKDWKAGCGHCFAVRREIWGKLGGFDEVKYPFAGNEDDFNDRVVRAGYDIAICTRAFSFHYWNRCTKAAAEAGELPKDVFPVPKFTEPPEWILFSGA